MKIQEALQVLKPEAQWVLRGDSYENLEWLDEKHSKPTKNEVESKMLENLPEPTITQKLESVGLNLDELKAAILGGN